MKNNNYITIRKEFKTPYIMIPTELLKHEKYREMSSNAKLLYACLLNRTSLSLQNHLIDKRGYAFIFFPREEARSLLCCNKNTIAKVFAELRKFDLIEEVPQRGQKANYIFVKMPLTAKRQEKTVKKVADMRKDRKKRREFILRRIQAAIIAKSAVKEKLETGISDAKRELHMMKHITVNQDTIASIRQQVEYAYFQANYSRRDIQLVDNIITSIAEMDTASATKIGDVYYPWDALQGLIKDISVDDIMALVKQVKERVIPGKIRNMAAYIKGMIIRFIQHRQIDLACFVV